MMKLYSCRFAPNGETPHHAIRTSQRVMDHGRGVDEAFAPEAFAGTRPSDVPILIDHDHTKRAGTVMVLAAAGDWHIADFVLDGPYASTAAEFIERSGKVSPGFREIEKDPISAREPYSWNWYTRAKLLEISILPPSAIAWYVGARVTKVYDEPTASSTPAYAATRAKTIAARETGRRHTGRDLVVDMSDGSQVIYHGAAKRVTRTPASPGSRRRRGVYGG